MPTNAQRMSQLKRKRWDLRACSESLLRDHSGFGQLNSELFKVWNCVLVISVCPVHHRCSASAINQGSHDSFLRVDNLLEQLTEPRETHTFCLLVYYMTKGTDEETHRARSRRVLCMGSCDPVELGCVQQSRSSLNLILWGILWRLYHVYCQLLTKFPVPLPSPENGGVWLKVASFYYAWVFWWPAPIQEPNKSSLIRTNHAPITQEIPRGLGAVCREPGSKTRY